MMTQPADTPVLCARCRQPLGHEAVVGTRILLRIGRSTQDAAHGWCDCGAEYWWSSSELRLRDLLRRTGRVIDTP